MGLGNSREWYGQRQRKPSSEYDNQYGKKRRRGLFRRKKPIPITQTIFCPPSYVSRPIIEPMPIYSPLPPISSPILPMSYNNFSAPSYSPPQPVMMLPQPVTPYVPPPVSISYVAPQVPAQPIYNNPQVPAATGLYSPSYPVTPQRFITDWTGGGQISPGFLGPPI